MLFFEILFFTQFICNLYKIFNPLRIITKNYLVKGVLIYMSM